MKTALKKLSLTFMLVLFCVICFLFSRMFYKKSQNELIETGHNIFLEVINVDLDQRLISSKAEYSFFYASEDTTSLMSIHRDELPVVYRDKNDSIRQLSHVERQKNILQSFLSNKEPIQVSSLDSLFYEKVNENGINAQTAIIYSNDASEKKEYSNPSETTYQNFYAYPAMTMGFENEIVLQAYIKISPVSIIRHAALPIGSITLLLLMVIGVVLLFPGKKGKPFQPDPVMHTDTNTDNQLINDFFIDVNKKMIIYKSKEIKLRPQSIEFLQLLLQSPDYFMKSDDLIMKLYGDDILEGRNRLNQTISRTRKELQAISELEIENVSKSGYKLIVHSDSSAPTE